ncbi:MAG: SMP-30/Gluconolactonase/LRE-like region, partial [Planctomycetota bacterium]
PAAADIVYALSTFGQLVRFDTSDPAGTHTALTTAGALAQPAGMVMGPDGHLYIGEGGNGSTIKPSVSRFNLTTNTRTTVHTFASSEVYPGSLAFRGNDLLVGQNPNFGLGGPVVRLANAVSGPVTVSDYTTGGSLASSPGLALAADGSLYVSSQTYNGVTGVRSGPVMKFDASGSYDSEFIADGASTGLYGPAGLAIAGNSLFTASIMTGTVLRTNLATGITIAFASTGNAYEASTLAVLSDGGLLVGNAYTGRIYRFDANGTLVSTYASGLGAIGALVAVPAPGTIALALVGLAGVGRRRRA